MTLWQRFVDWVRNAWNTFTHGVDQPPPPAEDQPPQT